VSGLTDIVFVFDTTSSMKTVIRNVKNNIKLFAETIKNEYKIDFRLALVEYRDIVSDGPGSTRVHKSGGSNWFTDVDKYIAEINSLECAGGGDIPETAIDGLEMARRLDFRPNVTKFFILVTDAPLKVNNSYGIADMKEMVGLLKKDRITVCTICRGEQNYTELYKGTDGLYAYINGNFNNILLEFADKIGKATTDATMIILDDYEAVRLPAPLSEGRDTDGDGLTDRQELDTSSDVSILKFIIKLLDKHNIPHSLYYGKTSVTMWSYFSHPLLPDTDFDGIGDKFDKKPKDNIFTGRMVSTSPGESVDSSHGKVEFAVDYREFFDDSLEYNENISILSSLLSFDIYGDEAGRNKNNRHLEFLGGADKKGKTAVEFLSAIGMGDVKTIEVGGGSGIDADDGTQFVVGHRCVEYQGEEREIIAVVFRGTNGTIGEWSSNMDVGADTAAYYNMTGPHPDWKNKANHKGFDVAANRALEQINRYLKMTSFTPGAKKLIWFTGHSRGAAIANIVGAHFVDNTDYLSCTYAYATPNCTTEADAVNYKTIFNIINSDDFVPMIPQWGFMKYGRVIEESIENNYSDKSHFKKNSYDKGTWEALMGKKYLSYNDVIKLQKTLSAMGKDRKSLYEYRCSCHGDGSGNIIGYQMCKSVKDQLKQIALIPDRAQKYTKIYQYNGDILWGYYIALCQTPAFIMQLFASAAGAPDINKESKKEVGPLKFTFGLEFAQDYNDVKNMFLDSQLAIFQSIENPHFPQSYYLLATKIEGKTYNKMLDYEGEN